MNNRFKWEVYPIADENNIVRGKNYRFTVLTSSLIRMEFDRDGIFEDRASQSIFYRNFKAVDYVVDETNATLIIETNTLRLKYIKGMNFASDTLSLELKCEPASKWRYSEEFEDLGGTAITLDGINGSIPLGRGVCSRNGFSVIDDSNSMVLNDEGWVDIRRQGTIEPLFAS